MPNEEIVVFGAPGTGKTYTLSRMVEEEQSESIVACSHTRAAAWELVRRVRLPEDNIGTVHSFCYRLLGRPSLAEEGTLLKQWNDANPLYAISPDGRTVNEPYGYNMTGVNGGALVGGTLFDAYNYLRQKLVPREKWYPAVQSFAERWEAFKQETKSIDFTDMLELALRRRYALDVDSVYVDEAQDLTPLAAMTVRSLARYAKRLVWAGDDDQTVYTFAGATADVMIDMPPGARQIVLRKSHRLPREIHAYSQYLIKRVKRRVPKNITPRDGDGYVGRLSCDCSGRAVADLVSSLSGYTAILATCGYMLMPIISALRQRGIAYCNPYRNLSLWNPLDTAEATRIRAFLRLRRDVYGNEARMWTYSDVAKWTEPLTAEVMIRGGKTWLAERAKLLPDKEITIDELTWLFPSTETLGAVLDANLVWYREALRASQRKSFEPLLELIARREHMILVKPRVVVGTIHSVKGAEFANVVLFSDLSRAGYEEQRTEPDNVTRVMYVGATRAREALYLSAMGRSTYPL